MANSRVPADEHPAALALAGAVQAALPALTAGTGALVLALQQGAAGLAAQRQQLRVAGGCG